jgi:POT family proton-dependent oligopeptide transporter
MSSAPLDRDGIAGHPKGLSTLFFTEMWERFSYYGMRAILMAFMTSPAVIGGLAFSAEKASAIYGLYTSAVYFTSIPGGFIADRLLGLRRAVLIGGVLIALGHYCLAINFLPVFYAGLALIVLGTGLLKANVASIVGQLYAEGDSRRDAGFSIFYMGINLGAFASPFATGFLAQHPVFNAWLVRNGFNPAHSWHWGFAVAGIGMTLGLVWYVAGMRRLGQAGLHFEKAENAGALWAMVAGGLIVLSALIYSLWPYRDFVILFGTVALFVWMFRQSQTKVEKQRMLAVIALFVFATLFWAGFEQAGSSLSLFAQRCTRETLLGYDFPSSWYQSVQPLFIILLAPVFAWFWMRLGSREPSSPAKFAYGLLFVGVGFLVMVLAARFFEGDRLRVSPMWLIACYFFHTLGELSLSPVGMSTVSKLAPPRVLGLMMGVWYLSISLGNFIGGRVSGQFETFPLPQLFGAVFLTSLAAAIILAFLVKPIRNLMSGVH